MPGLLFVSRCVLTRTHEADKDELCTKTGLSLIYSTFHDPERPFETSILRPFRLTLHLDRHVSGCRCSSDVVDPLEGGIDVRAALRTPSWIKNDDKNGGF